MRPVDNPRGKRKPPAKKPAPKRLPRTQNGFKAQENPKSGGRVHDGKGRPGDS